MRSTQLNDLLVVRFEVTCKLFSIFNNFVLFFFVMISRKFNDENILYFFTLRNIYKNINLFFVSLFRMAYAIKSYAVWRGIT